MINPKPPSAKINFMPTQYPWIDPWLRKLQAEIEDLKKRITQLESQYENTQKTD